MVIKRLVLIAVVAALMISVAAQASFADGDPLKKLGRGLSNCLTFPIELPNQISKTNNSDGPMAAVTYGLVKGIAMTAFRAVVGVYETLTFPVPVPAGYAPILTDPEFMLESWTA